MIVQAHQHVQGTAFAVRIGIIGGIPRCGAMLLDRPRQARRCGWRSCAELPRSERWLDINGPLNQPLTIIGEPIRCCEALESIQMSGIAAALAKALNDTLARFRLAYAE